MKKYINIFLITFTFFILFSFRNVSASTLSATLNFDNNEKFNYFYEMEHNTLFYKFLLSHEYDLEGYLSSLTGYNFDSYKYVVSIDKKLENIISYTNDTPPNDYTHVLNVYIGSSEMVGSFSVSGSSGIINLHHCVKIYKLYYNNSDLVYTFYYDSSLSGVSSYNSIDISTDLDNIQYFVSKNYASNIDIISSYSNTLDINKIIIDDTTYNIDTGFSSFWNKFKSLVTGGGWYKDYSLENQVLSYYKNNSLLLQNYSIVTISSLYSNTLNIPNNLTTLDLSKLNSYLFVPKNINNGNLNRYIYSSADSVSTTIGVSLIDMNSDNFYAYDLGQNSSGSNKTFMSMSYEKINTAYKIDLLYLLSKHNVDLNSSNYLHYGYYFHCVNGKGKTYLYYDSNSWTVYDLSYGLTGDLVISNPNTNNTVTITREDMKTVLSTYDMTGESIPITSISDFTEGALTEDFLSNGLDNISDLVSTLTGAFTFIGSMLTFMFSAFPPIIQQYLYFILIIGAVLIIIKLIRG